MKESLNERGEREQTSECERFLSLFVVEEEVEGGSKKSIKRLGEARRVGEKEEEERERGNWLEKGYETRENRMK